MNLSKLFKTQSVKNKEYLVISEDRKTYVVVGNYITVSDFCTLICTKDGVVATIPANMQVVDKSNFEAMSGVNEA